MAERKRRMAKIETWDDVPKFRNEAEEARWWETHQAGEQVLDTFQPTPLSEKEEAYRRSRTRPVAVRFDESTLRRVRTLAERRHKGYQTLLKEFVVERLYEEEKREGLLG